MKPASAKAKGRRLTVWVKELLHKVCPSLEDDDIRPVSSGANGEDILLSPAARKLLPLSIECKNLASMAFYKWMDQAASNCPKDCEPVVVAKANHRYPVVIVDATWFFENFPKRIRK